MTMTFPTITFKHGGIENGSALERVVESKFASLAHFIGSETDTRCEVEFQKVATHQSGKVFRVEANLWLHGTLFRAEATEESFAKAIDEVRAELDAAMRSAHDKRSSLLRRGSRKLKEIMRWGA